MIRKFLFIYLVTESKKDGWEYEEATAKDTVFKCYLFFFYHLSLTSIADLQHLFSYCSSVNSSCYLFKYLKKKQLNITMYLCEILTLFDRIL